MRRRRYLTAALLAPWMGPAVAQHGRLPHTLELPQPDGTVWRLSEQRGQAVLLNFWATWCAPCVSEIPALETLAAQYAPRGLQVVAINHGEPEATVRRFIEASGTRLTVLLDHDATTAKSMHIHTLPTTVGINRAGQVRFVVTGESDWSGALASQRINKLFF